MPDGGLPVTDIANVINPIPEPEHAQISDTEGTGTFNNIYDLSLCYSDGNLGHMQQVLPHAFTVTCVMIVNALYCLQLTMLYHGPCDISNAL